MDLVNLQVAAANAFASTSGLAFQEKLRLFGGRIGRLVLIFQELWQFQKAGIRSSNIFDPFRSFHKTSPVHFRRS